MEPSVGPNRPQNRTIEARNGHSALASEHGSDALRQALGEPRRPPRGGPARPALHRPAPRPRGHLAAGVRVAAAERAPGAAARSHTRDDGSQRPDRRRHAAGSALAAAARRARAELRGVRRADLRDRQRARGNRARDRARARPDAARADDRLRRLAHVDARRVRRARLRHRHLGGRARARDADAAAVEAEVAAHPLRRRAGAGRHREGLRAVRDRAARRRRRCRSRDRVRRPRDRGALDGGTAHDLQHVDRGRRARRPDRAGRGHVRVPARPPRRARRTSTPRSSAGARCRPTTTRSSIASSRST